MVIRLTRGGIFTLLFSALLLLSAPIFTPERIAPASAEIRDWGLSFSGKNAPPTGNASSEFLAEYDAFYLDTKGENKIYLTFDAGYENGNTPAILDALKAHGVKATFFLVGNYLDTAPELVKRMVKEGHTVGNHTENHPDMSKILDESAFSKELETLSGKYEALIGKPMEKLYRPPQGKFSEENLKMAKGLGYKTLFWSLAYVDWYTDRQPSREEALKKLTERIHPGAIVLLHSTSSTNAQVLDELLTRWEKAGYRVAPIEELYSQDAQTSGQ